ncbi:MAG: EscU/YscU/HrcU family type III secretion system export apparatus switch protein [Candidatus Sericytochromatia bacterium]
MGEKKIATSLKFNPSNDEAPLITATGTDDDAEFIIAVAEEYNVPVYKDAPLAKALGQLEVGDVIPPELYEAVAEVLAFVYSLDQNQDKAEQVLSGG